MTEPTIPQQTNSPFHQPVREAPERSATEISRSRDWAELSPAERYGRTQAEGDAATNRVDPQKVVQTRDRGGNLVLKDRETGQVIGDTAADRPADAEIAPSTAEKIRVGEFEVTESEIRELLADKAQHDLARANTPSDATGYEMKLPEDFRIPDGVSVTFDDPQSSPMIQAAQDWAHKRGLSQQDFSELLSVYAFGKVEEMKWFNDRHAQEMDSLGTNCTQRVAAVTRFIRAEMGDQDAKSIIAGMASSAQVRFYERMIQRATSQGAGRFTPQHRDMEPRGLSDEQWNGMSYGERKAYAERSSGRT